MAIGHRLLTVVVSIRIAAKTLGPENSQPAKQNGWGKMNKTTDSKSNMTIFIRFLHFGFQSVWFSVFVFHAITEGHRPLTFASALSLISMPSRSSTPAHTHTRPLPAHPHTHARDRDSMRQPSRQHFLAILVLGSAACLISAVPLPQPQPAGNQELDVLQIPLANGKVSAVRDQLNDDHLDLKILPKIPYIVLI